MLSDHLLIAPHTDALTHWHTFTHRDIHITHNTTPVNFQQHTSRCSMHSIHSIHSIHRPEKCPGFVYGSRARPCLHGELLLAAFQTHHAGRRFSCIFQSWHHFFSLLRASKSYHSQPSPCHKSLSVASCILHCLFDFLKHLPSSCSTGLSSQNLFYFLTQANPQKLPTTPPQHQLRLPAGAGRNSERAWVFVPQVVATICALGMLPTILRLNQVVILNHPIQPHPTHATQSMLKMKARRWFHEVAPELIEGDGAAAILALMCQDVRGCPTTKGKVLQK